MLKKMDKKICVLVVAAALLAVILIWLAFFLQLGKIGETADNIQKEQLDSLVRDERSQKIFEMGKELGDVETGQKEMSALLVDKDNAVPFLETLEKIAGTTGCSIKISVADLTKIKSQTAKKPAVQESDAESTKDLQKESQAQKTVNSQSDKQDFSNQLGFSLELTGKYPSLVDFLTKLENLPYFVRVYNFQISPIAKNQTTQAVGSGIAPAPGNQPAGAEGENKNIKSVLTIGVYTNGTK